MLHGIQSCIAIDGWPSFEHIWFLNFLCVQYSSNGFAVQNLDEFVSAFIARKINFEG